MKKIATLLFLLIGFINHAQSNLTVFNNNGQQFYVILNGVKQNSIPLTNVSVAGIKNGSYSVKLIFSDGKTADIDKNFFIEEPSDITTRIIFKKGKGKLQLIGMTPTKGSLNQNDVIVYRPDNSTVYSDAVVTQTVSTQQTTTSTTSSTGQQSEQVGINMNVGVNETQNTQGINQTVTVTDPNNPSGNFGMNININIQDPTLGGENVNMSVNMNGTGMNSNTTQTNQGNVNYSQTTTTTVTTTGSQVNSNATNTSNQVNTASNPVTTSSNSNCKNILGDGNAFVKDLKTITFEDDKKELIVKDLKNYCLTASQSYKIIETLTFEGDKLEMSKYLYDRIIDKENGKTLLPLFTFEDSKMEFREYMRK